MIEDDVAARRIATNQHGLVSVQDLVDLGIGAGRRRSLVDGRRWERVAPRVIRLVGSPATIAQRAMVAVLAAGAGGALRGRSAAAWWGIPGNALEPFDVLRARGHAGRSHRGAGRHEPVMRPDDHVRVLDGIPVVVPARALFDIAGERRGGAELPWWVDRMARMTDAAWSLRLVSGSTLHSMLDDLAQRGRPGIRVMRQVLADRPTSYAPPASGVESRLAQILDRAGDEPLRRQVDSGDERGWIGRVDFRDQRRPVIVEVQSERFHQGLTAIADDRLRIERLTGAGFEVVQVSDVQVWHQPDVVRRMVADARRRIDTAA